MKKNKPSLNPYLQNIHKKEEIKNQKVTTLKEREEQWNQENKIDRYETQKRRSMLGISKEEKKRDNSIKIKVEKNRPLEQKTRPFSATMIRKETEKHSSSNKIHPFENETESKKEIYQRNEKLQRPISASNLLTKFLFQPKITISTKIEPSPPIVTTEETPIVRPQTARNTRRQSAPFNVCQNNVKATQRPQTALLRRRSMGEQSHSNTNYTFLHTKEPPSFSSPTKPLTNVPMDQTLQTLSNLLSELTHLARSKQAYLFSLLQTPRRNSPIEMYSMEKTIGIGSFGRVRKAIHKLTFQTVAIKTYERKKFVEKSQWQRIEQESYLMKQIFHSSIIRIYETIETTNAYHIVMEHLPYSDLCTLIKQQKCLTETESQWIFFKLVQGLAYLHEKHIIHRDIKLENLLVDLQGKIVKLIDFGFATMNLGQRKLQTFCGTPSYMAPEILRHDQYQGEPVDIWSTGIVLYAMVVGCFPFIGKTYIDLYHEIIQNNIQFPSNLSKEIIDLFQRIFVFAPEQRLGCREILKSTWLNDQELPLQQPTFEEVIHTQQPRVLELFEANGIPPSLVQTVFKGNEHNAITTFYRLLLLRLSS